MRIGLLTNLNAGRNRDRIAELLGAIGQYPEVIHSETSSAGVVPEVLWEFAEKEVELVVVNGGDGTLQRVLSEILGEGTFGDVFPYVAPLRCGRTNMTALDLGTHRNTLTAMHNIVAASRTGQLPGRTTERQVLRVQHSHRARAQYGMFFGAGTIHRSIRWIQGAFPKGRAQGVLGATALTGALVARRAVLGDDRGILEPDKAGVLLDGAPLQSDRFHLLMASTLTRLFGGLRPFWGEGPGRVRFTAISSGAQEMLRTVPGILAGHPLQTATEERGYSSRNVDRAELQASCGYTVDGELTDGLAGGTLTVTADDRIRFVRG